jgi:microcystin degradation protein MlrC
MTTDSRMRIGVGYLIQESNSFSPVPTRQLDFGLQFGHDCYLRWQNTRTEFAGFLEIAARHQAEVVPLFAGWAMTAGPLLSAEFASIRRAVLDQIESAGRLDGILLALHGAMCAEDVDDCEGNLLEAIRAIAGSSTPLILTLDLHANVTSRMVRHATAVLGYKTYPHIDTFETGQAAGALLFGALSGKISPVMAMKKIPMIVPAENMQTAQGPMAEVFAHGSLLQHANPSILDVSVFGMQPWLDVEEAGCAVTVVAGGDAGAASRCAGSIADKFWALRRNFAVELWDPREAIRLALATEGQPVVLSESSDSPTAGSPGDSAEMLRLLMEEAPGTPAALAVCDPAAIETLWRTRPGDRIKLPLGGTLDRLHHKPVPFDGTVRTLTQGRFTFRGRWNHGVTVELGRTAVLESGAISIIVSEKPAGGTDADLFRSQGVEPRDNKIVVVKSATAFRDVYAPFAASIMVVDTAGVSSANLNSLPFRRVPRPIFPLDSFDWTAARI